VLHVKQFVKGVASYIAAPTRLSIARFQEFDRQDSHAVPDEPMRIALLADHGSRSGVLMSNWIMGA
jgi:hypothetical protein